MSKVRPDPAPTTWMIEAHSVFLSMSADGGLLHVEDLAADRQQRLELRVAGQLGGAERRVALDDEQLGLVDVVGPAVGQLGGQRGGLQRVLAALGLAVLARREPGLGGAGDLLHHQLGLGLLGALGRGEEALELGGHHLAYDGPRGRRAEHLLGLALELRLRQPDGDHGGETLEHVVLDDVGVVGLEHPRPAHGVVEGLGQRPASKPATCVPPLGVAITLTNERISVS